jgi:hypothetical protein
MGTPGVNFDKSKEDIEAALKNNKGILKNAAKELGYSRDCLLRHIKEYPDLVDLLKELRTGYNELVLDLAEDNILMHLEKGNLTATFYTLNTRGRERGWIARDNSPAEEEKKQDLIAFVSGFQAARSLQQKESTSDHNGLPDQKEPDHPSLNISQ